MPPTPIPPDALAALPARSLRGRFYRIVARHLRDRVLSIEGSERYGGRYNPKGAFGALYCGESPTVSSAEVRKAAPGRKLGPFDLATLVVELHRVLDLTEQDILEQLSLRSEDLVSADWTRMQELGRLARKAGFEALLVPSAAGPGRNLVVFLDRLDPASSVLLVAVEPAPL